MRARTKKELYLLLTVEGKLFPLSDYFRKPGQLFLPPFGDVRMQFLKQLLNGSKICF